MGKAGFGKRGGGEEERNLSEVSSKPSRGLGSPKAWPLCQLLPWPATVLSYPCSWKRAGVEKAPPCKMCI